MNMMWPGDFLVCQILKFEVLLKSTTPSSKLFQLEYFSQYVLYQLVISLFFVISDLLDVSYKYYVNSSNV